MDAILQYTHKSAKKLTKMYFEKHKNVFLNAQQADIDTFRDDVFLRFYNVISTIFNIVAMVSYTDEEKMIGVDPTNIQRNV